MTPHTWARGDSLSSLAASHGLASWRRIWDEPTNAALRNLRGSPENLRVGDVINIPARRAGEVGRPTDARAEFVRAGVPPASIRFISDGGDPTTTTPTELNILQVSTFVTTSRLPNSYTARSRDPRNFKLEVYDEGAGGEFVDAEIEALKPRLDLDGRLARDADGDLTCESFTARRTLAVRLRRFAGTPHTFRSRYLRLVTDNPDRAARPQQTLLADHDSDNLDVEILDQQVVARYTAASGETLGAQAVIGDSERRVRSKVFVVRTAFGAAGLAGGVTLNDVRRHVLCWVRRTYAAANMTPRLVEDVEAVDPVENMVWIRSIDRRGAQGNRRIRFRVNTTPTPTMITVTTVADESPRDIADRLATEARNNLPGTYLVDVFDNTLGFNRARSADILINTVIAGQQVIIDQASSLDGRVRIEVGRVRPNRTPTATPNWYNVGSAANRALFRNYRRLADAVAVFVIGRFRPAENAIGFAYGRQFREAPQFQGAFPVAGSCLVEARTTAPADRRVHTTDHEIGHIIIDMVHFAGHNTELMTDAPANLTNTVNDSKRLSDRVLPYQEFVGGVTRNYPINPNDEIRNREQAQFIEGWDVWLSP